MTKNAKNKVRLTRATKTQNDGPNPYRVGSKYGTMFEVGSKKFHTKHDLITATMTALGLPVTKADSKTYRRLGYNLSVLKAPSHSANGNRSASETNAAGLIKLIDKRVLVGGVKAAPAAPAAPAKAAKKAPKKQKTVVTKQAVAPKAPVTPSAPAAGTPGTTTTTVTTTEVTAETQIPSATPTPTPSN